VNHLAVVNGTEGKAGDLPVFEKVCDEPVGGVTGLAENEGTDEKRVEQTHSKRSNANRLVGDCAINNIDEGVAFVGTAFAVDHEDADEVALGVDEAVGSVAAAVAVGAFA